MATTFNVPMILLQPTWSESYGVGTKTFPDVKDGKPFFGSFRSFSGTERVLNGLLVQNTTGLIETWYDPDIKADCRIALAESGDVYEIEGEPEDMYSRHQFLRCRVKLYKGGA